MSTGQEKSAYVPHDELCTITIPGDATPSRGFLIPPPSAADFRAPRLYIDSRGACLYLFDHYGEPIYVARSDLQGREWKP